VLLEEGVRDLEKRQAGVLRRFSEQLYDAAKRNSRRQDDAYADLARFAGVGLALQDRDSLEKIDDDHRATVAETLRRLETGQGKAKVLFFGLPVLPERLRASGFYTNSDVLGRYFAARQWYATCDFRLKSQPETERALRLVVLIESDKKLKSLYEKLTKPYDALLGPPDDSGVQQYAKVLREVTDGELSTEKIPALLAAFRREAAKLPAPRINDQWLLPEAYARFAEEIKGFRLLPPRQLPSAILFQNTIDPVVKGRMMPSGIDLFATGPLNCDAGRRVLRASAKNAETAGAVMKAEVTFPPDSLHGEALRLLGLLQKPLPKSAPQALQSPAWHDKQLWTALAAWAEQRHTWALHSKLTIHYMGMAGKPPGYVSPYPEFFRRLGQLARDTSKALQVDDAQTPDPRIAAAEELLACVEVLRRVKSRNAKPREGDYDRIMRFSQFLQRFRPEGPPETDQEIAKLCEDLEKLARRWASAETPNARDRMLIASIAQPHGSVTDLLTEFAGLCDRLAAIAQKHLEGKPLAEDDMELIKGYGETLAKFHFYGGNAWLTPRDDFPLVAPVFASPVRSETLYAGIGRPEALWVIIDVGGKPTLLRGAVLSFREFPRPAGKPLDDEMWIEEVREGKTPSPPAFTRSFRKTITVDEVLGMIRNGVVYPPVETMPDRAITRAMIKALVQGGPKSGHFKRWLRACVCQRATDEDVADLLELLSTDDPITAGEYAFCIAELNWKPHRAAVMELMRHDKIQYADCGAYILANKPEHVDPAALATTFDEQKPRTRRLCCYVLGHLKRSDKAVTDLLLKMLDDKEASVRYQAALAAAERDVRDARIERKLIAGLDDPNTQAAAAAVRALVKLNIEESAPHMLTRLKKTPAKPPVSTQPEEDFSKGTRYSGAVDVMVLSEDRLNRPSLNSQLLAGLGKFRYRPAREHIRTMLSTRWGDVALEALMEIEPSRKMDLAVEHALGENVSLATRRYALDVIRQEGDKATKRKIDQRLRRMLLGKDGPTAVDALLNFHDEDMDEFLLEVALNKRLTGATRAEAVQRLRWQSEMKVVKRVVKRLAPLLNDKTKAQEDLRICDHVADTVANIANRISYNDLRNETNEAKALRKRLAGWTDNFEPQIREKKIEAARQWARTVSSK